MKDFFFKPDMSSVDCVLFAIAAHELSRGDLFASAMIFAGATLVHMITTDRWYE